MKPLGYHLARSQNGPRSLRQNSRTRSVSQQSQPEPNRGPRESRGHRQVFLPDRTGPPVDRPQNSLGLRVVMGRGHACHLLIWNAVGVRSLEPQRPVTSSAREWPQNGALLGLREPAQGQRQPLRPELIAQSRNRRVVRSIGQ